MARFNTHGGYFSPKGYFRVDAGGSHDENPNGGVQVGVDQQGVPNMLEENEPVYNDYVYSDNITADEAILEKHNIPASYAGKLYSYIADKFVEEAEQRPLDPISNNGLNAMLVRLADAQEEQKQIQVQKELEDELSKLTPEELDELEQILAQEEMEEEQPQEVAPEQINEIPQQIQPPVGMPVMANGGYIRKFEDGTPGVVEKEKGVIQDVSAYLRNIEDLSREPAAADVILEDLRATGYDGTPHINRYDMYSDSGLLGLISPAGSLAAIPAMRRIRQGARVARQGAEAARGADIAAKLAEDAKKAKELSEATAKTLKSSIAAKSKRLDKLVKKGTKLNESERYFEAEGVFDDAKSLAADIIKERKAATRAVSDASRHTPKGFEYYDGRLMSQQGNTYGAEIWKDVRPFVFGVPAIGTLGASVSSDSGEVETLPKSNTIHKSVSSGQDKVSWAMGGKLNRFDDGGWKDFIDSLDAYLVSRNRGGVDGTYRIDRQFPLGAGFENIKDLENSDAYRAFTDYVLANPTNENVLNYLRALDRGTHQNVAKLFDTNGNLVPGWNDIYNHRRYDQKGGIYHFTPADLAAVNTMIGAQSAAPTQASSTTVPATKSVVGTMLNDYAPRAVTDPNVYEPEVDAAIDNYRRNNPEPLHNSPAWAAPLATFPRYAGALTSGVMGLYNAFQEPDRYSLGTYEPVLPTGQMDLVDPVYNPLDQNMATNAMLASGAGTVRELRNSGLGPSTGAAILAADYNTGRNLGNTFTTVWDANNQRLNNIIVQRNNNASTLGQFNYGINRDRAGILNQATLHNLRNGYLQQRLNYEAEAQKYAAIQNQLDNVSKALAGIGRENMFLNQINFDDAYDYVTAPNGVSAFAPRYAKCGGFIKKYKK